MKSGCKVDIPIAIIEKERIKYGAAHRKHSPICLIIPNVCKGNFSAAARNGSFWLFSVKSFTRLRGPANAREDHVLRRDEIQ
jgi:hypothetical protein